MRVKFGISFVPPRPAELAPLCIAAEDAGYDRIGFVDSQSIYREPWVSCTLAASHTSRDRKSTRLNSSHSAKSRMPSSA